MNLCRDTPSNSHLKNNDTKLSKPHFFIPKFSVNNVQVPWSQRYSDYDIVLKSKLKNCGNKKNVYRIVEAVTIVLKIWQVGLEQWH